MRILVLAIVLLSSAAAPAAEEQPVIPQAPPPPPVTLAPAIQTPIPMPRSPSLTERLRLETKRRDVDRNLLLKQRQPFDSKTLRDLGTLNRQRDRIDDALGR